MGKVKEHFEDSRRKQINKAAETYLCDQEDGDLCDAYAVLLEESDKGNGDCRAADFVTVWEPLENSVSVDEMIRLIEDGIREPEVPAFIGKIGWESLRTQKTTLLFLIENQKKHGLDTHMVDDLDGLINMIDGLQDFAVDELGIPEMSVFDFEEEEKRDASTPAENFARESAESIFDELCESDGFHVDDEMSVEFIASVMSDRYQADIIKAKIRNQILDDLKLSPQAFRDADGNLEYDSDMRSDYEGVVTAYIREEFKKRSCKYKVWVEVERIGLDADGNEESYTDEECPIGIAYRDNLEDAVKLQELIENSFGEL